MNLFIETIDLARSRIAIIFDRCIFKVTVALALSVIFCNTGKGQSPNARTEKNKTDTVPKGDLNYLFDDSSIAVRRNHPLVMGNPFLQIPKHSFKQHSPEGERSGNRLLMEMDRKLDSAWRKFDQRCRHQDGF